MLLVWGPLWLVELSPDNLDEARAVMEERRSMLAALVAIGGGIGVYYTHLRHQLDRDSNRTDRYTSAVEQLGHDSSDVQLGGIYALERIALDSVRDRGVISEVLSAFVRAHTQATVLSTVSDSDGEQPGDRRPSTVVQAALRVLCRRPADDLSYPPADLTGANLAGADLTSANLSKAHLSGAQLSGARLHSNPTSPNLNSADVAKGRFRTDLTGADLTGADLTGANLTGANLTGAKLWLANLTGASLIGANLTDAVAIGANFTRAELSGATVTGAMLDRATFDGVNLTNVIGLGSGSGHDEVVGH